MILYHFTCKEHLASILSDRCLFPSESNIGSPLKHVKPFGAHYAPDVVWLTNKPDVKHGCHGLLGPSDKAAIRITVDVDAIPWIVFAKKHGINKKWYRALDKTGGKTSNHWFVFEGKILISEWKEVRVMATGEIIYS